MPVRQVAQPAGPHWSLLDPLLDPGTYAVDGATHGRDRVVGTFVLSPGDIRGTRFVYERAVTGCSSLNGSEACVACGRCGALVASRTDDCDVAQETRLFPDLVVRETCEDDPNRTPDPLALYADWDDIAPDTRTGGWCPNPPAHDPISLPLTGTAGT